MRSHSKYCGHRQNNYRPDIGLDLCGWRYLVTMRKVSIRGCSQNRLNKRSVRARPNEGVHACVTHAHDQYSAQVLLGRGTIERHLNSSHTSFLKGQKQILCEYESDAIRGLVINENNTIFED